MRLAIGLFVASVIISVVLLNPKIKAKTIQLLMGSDRQILSTMEMDVEGVKYQVLKVHTLKGLAVELYKNSGDDLIFLDAHQLTDKKDASYKFGDKKFNLLLKDINSDGVNEIILPSLDKNMKARLNVFSLDRVNERLEKVSQH